MGGGGLEEEKGSPSPRLRVGHGLLMSEVLRSLLLFLFSSSLVCFFEGYASENEEKLAFKEFSRRKIFE